MENDYEKQSLKLNYLKNEIDNFDEAYLEYDRKITEKDIEAQ